MGLVATVYALPIVLGAYVEAGIGDGLAVTLVAFAAGCEPECRAGEIAHERDTPVPQIDQVLGRDSAAHDIIERHITEIAMPAVRQDDRDLGPAKICSLVVIWRE